MKDTVMGMLKRIGLDQVWRQHGARVIATVLEFLHKTCRMEFDLHPQAHAIMTSDEGILIGYWHGRLLFMPLGWRDLLKVVGKDPKTIGYSLSSPHRDGAIMADALKMFGVKPIMGASGKRGVEAFGEIRRTVKEGGCIAIAVDGGKGPRQRVQGGIMFLAKHTGRAVVPAIGSCQWGRQLNTWDRLLIPFPWTNGVLMMGAPIRVPKDADRDELARLDQQFEDALNALVAEADLRCGRAPTPPAAHARWAGSQGQVSRTDRVVRRV
ncbi:MAG TPA: DUF374 domain-containing protein [Geminicoccus sp.]|uniref:lysophospholipid acyltransferase family protein n=1 Tax=Geminicoccus sp. TaxID=2024832 RepID=UPI002BF1FCEF|nr:DUF374 domain-containing protein [Geminicoccus sp.]HWL69667.1 DUF374 domain-containing protein [Geminicoccus sp.]